MKLLDFLQNILLENNLIIIRDKNNNTMQTLSPCVEIDIEEMKDILENKIIEIYREKDVLYIKINTEMKKYFIRLYDYGNGQTLFETDCFDTEEQALQSIDNFNFNINNYQLRLDLMFGYCLVRNLKIGR